jgi:hypothetical protein
MRRLAIGTLGIWLATAAAAHAGGDWGRIKSPTPKIKSDAPSPAGFGATYPAPKAPEPYRPHARPEFAPIQTPVAPKPIGPQTFKPFKGTSTYDGPSAVKPYKPPKMKSVYDH